MNRTNGARTWFAYAAMLLVAVAFVAWVLGRGARLETPAAHVPALDAPAQTSDVSPLVPVLLALATIIAAARGVGAAFERWLGQPAVLGEIAAGLMLGPSVLDVGHLLMPDATAPTLGFIAKLGVVLFMFLVGLEFDPAMLRGRAHATLSISHASIVVPFALGTALALALYPRYAVGPHGFPAFALFIGISVSVTAFPVLVRILTSRRIHRTALGATAIACAAVDDVTSWCLLAFVSGVASAEHGAAWTTLAGAGVYVTVLLLVVRPFAVSLAARVDASRATVSVGTLALVFAGLFVSAAATEAIGLHALFGAFALGALVPHDSRLAEHVRARLEDLVVVVFLPVLFTSTGMRTRVGLLATPADALFAVLVIGVATVGKFGGSFVAARFTGLGWRESSALGVLMNTRGLMELIVLNVGLEMGVLSPTLFTMLVIMALVTTFATTPLLDLVLRGRGLSDTPAAVRLEAHEPP